MREVVAELKSLRLHGMAQRYEELLAEPGSGIQSAGWLVQSPARRRGHRPTRALDSLPDGRGQVPGASDLAGFDFGKSRVDEN